MIPATGAGRFAARRRAQSVTALLRIAVSAAVVGVAVVLAACSTVVAQPDSTPSDSTPPDSTPLDSTYGALPTFLPTASFQPDSELVGTATRPALTTEGDSVRVQLDHATVHATVSGPEVPGAGLPYQSPTTTCTWTVDLTNTSATAVPVVVADFTTIDHLGTVYHPTLVPGAPIPPSTVRPGQSVNFQVRAVMQTGEGLMRWAPGGPHIVASWDFEVETD